MNNPILEAELCAREPERNYITCVICKGKIYQEDEIYEGDTYYDFDEGPVCEECLREYAKKYRRIA